MMALVQKAVVGMEVAVLARHEPAMMSHHHFMLVAFETLPSAQKASIVEHVLAGRVQCPVVAFARVTRLPGNFDKTVIQ